MSMVLAGSDPATAGRLEIITQDYPTDDGIIRIKGPDGVTEMSYSDFAIFAFHVLTNTVLRGPDDPRLALLRSVKLMLIEHELNDKTPHRITGPYPVQ